MPEAKKAAAKKKVVSAEASVEEALETGRVKRIRIQNFRAIGKHAVTIDLDKIVVLVGPNNSGKSSVLRAYEVVMLDGSKEGHLTLDDFPNGKIDPDALPTIELHTAVTKHPPSSKWVTEVEGDPIVRERWVWNAPGGGKRQGWNGHLENGGNWDEEEVPWGAANVANSRRPQPHWIKAFDKPEDQAEKINKLITTMITDKAHQIPATDGSKKDDGTSKTEFQRLLEELKRFQDAAFKQTEADVADIEQRLTEMVGKVFSDHVINFALHPPIDKDIKLFSTGSSLAVGHKNGWKGPLEYQGSGARRTILWAVLRVLSEQAAKKSERPRVLLIDEPELCLHPDAVREACRVLYDLADKAGWQVIVTTHSPVFIDLGRDHTTVVRVERAINGTIVGTTLFRPDKASLTADDRENLQLMNIYDPYVAEFFFGGSVIIVEGDTEYSAFKHIIAEVSAGKVTGVPKEKFSNVQIIRARGKSTIVSLCKILNHFSAAYSILHDTDSPTYVDDGKEKVNPAWSVNKNITEIVAAAPFPSKIRVVASKKNFESAYLGAEAKRDKPYNAIRALKAEDGKFRIILDLLISLTDQTSKLPAGALDSKQLKPEDVVEAA